MPPIVAEPLIQEEGHFLLTAALRRLSAAEDLPKEDRLLLKHLDALYRCRTRSQSGSQATLGCRDEAPCIETLANCRNRRHTGVKHFPSLRLPGIACSVQESRGDSPFDPRQ